jgi:DNA-binding transcriptional LysR family regulator
MAATTVDLNRVDLNLLVAFDVLMDERSVTRAAQRLNVGQPTMSGTLARLRRLFGDPLLVREGRGLVATPVAEALAKQVRTVLADVQSIMAARQGFDPSTAERTFDVIASDYTMIVLLTPLTTRLAASAPGVRLRVAPPGTDYVDQLRRGQVDLAVMPREAFPSHREFPHHLLFTERFVCAVDAANDAVGERLTVEEFTRLPYLATSCGHQVSPVEAQLDLLGIPRNPEVTTAFGLAPLLLPGTAMVALVHERLARLVADRAALRLLDPPMPLLPIHQLMLWHSRAESDPGHRWLRGQVLAQVAALDEIA